LHAGLLSTIWLFCWKKEFQNYSSFEKGTITRWNWGWQQTVGGFNIFDIIFPYRHFRTTFNFNKSPPKKLDGGLLLLLLMVYYKIIALESELRSYLQTLVKNIKKYLVLQALYYSNCLLIYELIWEDKYTFIFTKFTNLQVMWLNTHSRKKAFLKALRLTRKQC
jgi:hypothetical protein